MPHYNDTQIQAANQVDLAAFLFAHGEVLKKRGKQLLWEKHQVWIDGCRWYTHYDSKGGYAVGFVMRYFGLSFQDAVKELLGESNVSSPPIEVQPKEEKILVLPKPNVNMNRVYAYLMQERFIDREIISHFAHQHTLYEDEKYHNCIFIGKDEDGIRSIVTVDLPPAVSSRRKPEVRRSILSTTMARASGCLYSKHRLICWHSCRSIGTTGRHILMWHYVRFRNGRFCIG